MYHFEKNQLLDVCPICGNEVPASDLFCERCGTRIYAHYPQEKSKVDALSEMSELKAEADGRNASLKADYPDVSCMIDDFRAQLLDDINDILDDDEDVSKV